MSALGSLVVKLALEYAQFSKGLDDSEQDVKKHAKGIQDTYNRMAGGIERSATSLRNTVVGVFAGAISVAGMISAIGKVRTETVAAEQEQNQLAAALKSTGESAGWSQEKLNAMAEALAKNSNFGAGELNQAQARLLSYTGIVGETFPRAMQAVADMSARMGTSVTASAESIGRALDIPSAGLTALTQQGFRFTDAQKNMVTQLERTGRVAEAQAIILQALEGSYGGAAAAARDTLGGALAAVGESINSLMTADSASLPGLRNSVEELNALLQSDSTRSAFAFYVQLMVDTANAAVRVSTALGQMGAWSWLQTGNTKPENAEEEIGLVKARMDKVRETRDALQRGGGGWLHAEDIAVANSQLATMEARLRGLQVLSEQHKAQQKSAYGWMDVTYESLAEGDEAALSAIRATSAALQNQGEVVGRTDEYLKRFGSTTQKAALEVAEWKRKLGDGFTPAMQADVEAYWAKQDAGAKAGAQSAKQLEQAYTSLKDSIAEKAAALKQELLSGEKLSEAEKLRIKYAQDLKGSLAGLSAAKRQSIEADITALSVLEKEEEARKALAKALEDDAKAFAQLAQQRKTQLESIVSTTDRLRQEERAYVLAASAGISHSEAMERLALARLEDARAIMLQGAGSFQEIEEIEKEIAARKELLGLMGQKTVREANAKAAKDLASDWDKTSQLVGQTLSDYIMGGGRDAATYLKRLFSTLILQPVVKTVVGSVLGLGGSGDSGSTGQAGSLLSSAQNLSSLYSAVTGGITTTMASGIASLGSAFGSSALTSFAAGMKGSTLAAGLAGPTTAGASGAMGLGATVGAALPWVAGGLAVVSLLSSMFGSNPKEHTGGVYSNATADRGAVLDALGLTKHARGDFTSRQNEGVDAALATTIDGLLESYAGFAKRATGDVRELSVYAAFATNPITKDEDAYGYMRVIDRLTGEVVGRASRRDGDGLGNDPAKAYSLFTGEIAGVLVKELKAADLPGWMHSVFDSLGDSVTLENYSAAVQQIAQIDAGFLSLGQTMGMFANLSGQMQTSLLTAFGSMEGLATTASSFYNSYYTEAQRMETLAAQVQSALSGLNVQIDPRLGDVAKAQFKEAVEAAFAAGKGELGAQLLAMNQSFATAAEYAAKAGKDMQQAALAVIQSAVDGAFANLEAAIGRERTYWDAIATKAQEAVGKLSGTLSMLTSNAQALYGSVNSTQQMMAAQGMVYIENALQAVRSGASVAGYDKLQEAVSAARGGLGSKAYVSVLDQERDALLLASQLSELGDLTDSQLTVQDRQLRAAQSQIAQLDQTLAYWQQSLSMDALGIDATMTVAQAVAALAPLLVSLQLAQTAGSYAAAIKAVTPGGEGPKAALYQQMLGSGLTDAQIRAQVDKTTGVQTDSDWDYLKKLSGIPGYAVGGLHAGGAHWVGEKGPELRFGGPARYYSAQQSQSMLTAAMQGGSSSGANDQLVTQLLEQNKLLAKTLDEVKEENRMMRVLLERVVRGELSFATNQEKATA